jgi:hypothetical protein
MLVVRNFIFVHSDIAALFSESSCSMSFHMFHQCMLYRLYQIYDLSKDIFPFILFLIRFLQSSDLLALVASKKPDPTQCRITSTIGSNIKHKTMTTPAASSVLIPAICLVLVNTVVSCIATSVNNELDRTRGVVVADTAWNARHDHSSTEPVTQSSDSVSFAVMNTIDSVPSRWQQRRRRRATNASGKEDDRRLAHGDDMILTAHGNTVTDNHGSALPESKNVPVGGMTRGLSVGGADAGAEPSHGVMMESTRDYSRPLSDSKSR